MPSQWFCKVLGQEMGPLSFQHLAEMVRAGTLTEDDPVRREGRDQWTTAREVVGLLRAARKQPAKAMPPDAEAKPPPAPAPAGTHQRERPSAKPRRVGRRQVLAAGAVVAALVVVVAGVWAWRATRRPRFPEPVLGRPRPVDEEQLASILGPRPGTPSIPDLKEGVPQPIPGLDDVDPVYSFSLSADMCTIVFSGRGKMYLAIREEVASPFPKPRPIESCDSPVTDERPALSPDGLEMIYAQRSGNNAEFFYARRESSSTEFGEPIPWDAPSSVEVGDQLMWPRFLDSLRVTFTVVEADWNNHWIFLSERAARNSAFGAPRELPFWKTEPTAFYTKDGLRAYSGWDAGLFLTVRRAKNRPFGPPIVLADAAVTGPIVGVIWVAPQEDVIFYLSPGPGKEIGSGRKLWMIRL